MGNSLEAKWSPSSQETNQCHLHTSDMASTRHVWGFQAPHVAPEMSESNNVKPPKSCAIPTSHMTSCSPKGHKVQVIEPAWHGSQEKPLVHSLLWFLAWRYELIHTVIMHHGYVYKYHHIPSISMSMYICATICIRITIHVLYGY